MLDTRSQCSHAEKRWNANACSENHEMDRIIRLPELLQVTGLSTSTVYRMMAEGTFARSVRLNKNSVGWRSSSVEEWIASRPEVEVNERPATPRAKSRASARNRKGSRDARC